MSTDALALLRPVGKFRHTPYPGVLIGRVSPSEADRTPTDSKSVLAHWHGKRPELFKYLNRFTPIDGTTCFEGDDVTEELCIALEDRAASLCGQRFYVRANLRGLKGRVERQACERALGSFLWEQSAKHRDPAVVGFDDVDVVVMIEVIGKRAGFGFLNREVRGLELVKPR